jgi:hypothetical protein
VRVGQAGERRTEGQPRSHARRRELVAHRRHELGACGQEEGGAFERGETESLGHLVQPGPTGHEIPCPGGVRLRVRGVLPTQPCPQHLQLGHEGVPGRRLVAAHGSTRAGSR